MDVIMPQLGETVTEGTVANWYKKVGDTVRADEPLFEVETDKVTTEIPSIASGVFPDPAGGSVSPAPTATTPGRAASCSVAVSRNCRILAGSA